MAEEQHAPGGFYSSHNKIPNVKQFVQGLDKDKQDRDKQIDDAARRQAAGEAVPHKPDTATVKGTQKVVRDPTTGRDVTIENVDKSMMESVKNPQLSVPNANLGKDTVCFTGSAFKSSYTC